VFCSDFNRRREWSSFKNSIRILEIPKTTHHGERFEVLCGYPSSARVIFP
jgi:hypothetical protein